MSSNQAINLPPRFWQKSVLGGVASQDLGRCLNWTGALSAKGYGLFNLDKRIKITSLAHRLIYIEAFGEISPKLEISHLCHNRRCIRLGHLVAETHLNNIHRKPKISRCPKGHAEYLTRKNGKRECAVCARERRKRYPNYYDPAKRHQRWLEKGC